MDTAQVRLLITCTTSSALVTMAVTAFWLSFRSRGFWTTAAASVTATRDSRRQVRLGCSANEDECHTACVRSVHAPLGYCGLKHRVGDRPQPGRRPNDCPRSRLTMMRQIQAAHPGMDA